VILGGPRVSPKRRGGGAGVSKRNKAKEFAEREAMFRRFVRLTFAMAAMIVLLLAAMAMFLV